MKYDPFEVLQPPKSMIKDCIKAFNEQARLLLEVIRELRQTGIADWLVEEKEREHKQLTHKIRTYQHYLNDEPLSNDRELLLSQAKARPISELFNGKLTKRAGRFYGKCPFHDDSSPSFVIYANNSFHCFGCNANGDSLDFIMKRDNIDFNQALRFLGSL